MNRERYISLTIKTYLIIPFLAIVGCQQSPNAGLLTYPQSFLQHRSLEMQA